MKRRGFLAVAKPESQVVGTGTGGGGGTLGAGGTAGISVLFRGDRGAAYVACGLVYVSGEA